MTAAAAAAFITAVYTLIRLGLHPLYRALRTIERVFAVDEHGKTEHDRRLDAQDTRLAVIERRTEQLVPNGGTSLRDDVTGLKEHLARIDAANATEHTALWREIAQRGAIARRGTDSAE